YYMTEEEVSLQGQRTIKDGKIEIERPEETILIEGGKLSLQEVYPFFKPEQKPIILLLLLYVVLLFIAGFFQYTETYMLEKSSNQIIRKLRKDVFAYTMRMPMDYYQNRQ